AERLTRYNDMMAVLRKNDITHWRESYLQDLRTIPPRSAEYGPATGVTSL
ncbi:alpha,alpha-trehalose-phosphate synthase, partial [Escherichia coli]